MTLQVGEWLPRDCFTEEAVRPVMAGPVAAWSGRWFAHAQTEITAVRMSSGRPRIAQSFLVHGALTEAELSGRGKRALLETALDTDLSGLTLTESDHKVLDAFATEVLKDLLTALDGIGDGGSDDMMLSVTLSLGEKEIAVVTLPSRALIPAMKAAIGSTRRSDKTPKSRSEALKPVKLVAEGLLGRAELTLEDVKELSLGDVIILDSSLNGPVELRLSSSGQCIARGKLIRANNRVSIQL